MEVESIPDAHRKINKDLLSMSHDEFLSIIVKARGEIQTHPDFSQASWNWVHELDDDGFFIFCYLVEEYNDQILTKDTYENTVYTLVLLKKKFLPNTLEANIGITRQIQLQFTLNLYEALKRGEMSWDQCEDFMQNQIDDYQATRLN